MALAMRCPKFAEKKVLKMGPESGACLQSIVRPPRVFGTAVRCLAVLGAAWLRRKAAGCFDERLGHLKAAYP